MSYATRDQPPNWMEIDMEILINHEIGTHAGKVYQHLALNPALTATALRSFWRRSPAVSEVIGANADVAFKIGLGERPWLRQVTFSIWPDAAAMARFARTSGPHARALQAARTQGWFAEELYARYAVLGGAGRWEGRDPLAPLRAAPRTEGEAA